MTIVLVLAMSLSFGVRDWVEGGVILAVIIINITMYAHRLLVTQLALTCHTNSGFMQEYRAYVFKFVYSHDIDFESP